jgi:Tetrapyrrole (Corrin/Porphyrin) Methylases
VSNQAPALRRTAPVLGRRPGTLVIGGSGISAIGQFTLETQSYLAWAESVFFCVSDPATERWILDSRPDAVDLYTLYDNDKHRRITYVQMAEKLLQDLRQGLNVLGLFYGHPGIFVNPSHRAIAIAREEGHSAYMLPAVSALDCLFADLGLDPSKHGTQIVEATDLILRRRPLLTDSSVIIFQVGAVGDTGFNFSGFKNAKLAILIDYLKDAYGEEHEIYSYVAAQYPSARPQIDHLALSQFSDPNVARRVTGISTFYIPPKELRPVDREKARDLGFNPGPARAVGPYAPFSRPYEQRELDYIAELARHVPSPHYKPTRPPSAVYELIRDLALTAGLRDEYKVNPESVLARRSGLSPSDKAALLSGHMGRLRLLLQRTSREVAVEFTRRVLQDPALARRYHNLLFIHRNETNHRAIVDGLRELGYDTEPAEIADAFAELSGSDLALWSGKYDLAGADAPAKSLVVNEAQGVYLDHVAIVAPSFSDGVLKWNTDEGNSTSGRLRFLVQTRKEDDALPSSAYLGPQCAGVIWSQGAEQPSEDNTFGKVGAGAISDPSDAYAAAPLAIWAGRFDTALKSRDGTWREGPQLTIQAGDSPTVRIGEGTPISGTYSNSNLGWVGEAGRYGTVSFYNAAETVGLVGRLWQGAEDEGLDVNVVGKRIEAAT